MKKKKKKVVQDLPVEEAAPSPSSAAAAEPTTESAPAAAASSTNDDSPAASSAPPADAAVEGDGAEMFADLKKKKKKKKEMPADIDLTSSDLPTASAEGLTKKKKSKKTATDFAKELDDLDAERQDQVADELDREIGEDPFEGGEGDADDGDDDGEDVDAWVKEGRVATYPELLRRFFSQLHAHNPELAGEKRRYTMVPPQVTREGTKKTMFANITDICRRMRRQPEHVIQFLYSELGTQGSIDGSQRLIMKGRYNNKQIENVLRKYIIEYVTCKICKSSDTLLGKENRLFFVTCESCGSRNSVSTIKAGFQAQVGRRIKAA